MKTLLVATDFSPAATNAVNYAADLANYLSAKLVLVNAYSIPLGGYDSMQPLEMISALQQSSDKGLAELKKNIISRIGFDPGIEYFSEAGSPFEIISEIASKQGADCIVMGIVGEAGKLKEKIIGSSTLKVAKDLDLPLFIISEGVKYSRIHTLCLASDLEHIEESTLLYSARYFATLFDAELEVVTVKKQNAGVVWESPKDYTFFEKRLNQVRHKSVIIKNNNPSKALEYYFKFHKTDLVMVNPKKHTVFQKLFEGSVTKYLAFHATVPLLVIH